MRRNFPKLLTPRFGCPACKSETVSENNVTRVRSQVAVWEPEGEHADFRYPWDEVDDTIRCVNEDEGLRYHCNDCENEFETPEGLGGRCKPMTQQRRKQSLATALRHVRAVIGRAEGLDFTTSAEDLALRTVYSAIEPMQGFLKELAQDKSICDCADRSWHGEGHDTQCNVERIAYLLTEIGQAPVTQYYVLFVDGDVDPYLHGPFQNEGDRDRAAHKLRAADSRDPKSGIYRLECTPAPKVDAYSGAFFEDDNANE